MPKQSKTDAGLKELREFGLRYPGAELKSPWPEHLDLVVKGKTFAFLSVEGRPFAISVKLPQSNALALELPFAEPTGYGLGRSGWVSAKFPDRELPLPLLKAWIDESYRAQAPKKLVAALDSQPQSSKPEATRARAAGKKSAPTRTKRALRKPAAPKPSKARAAKATSKQRKKSPALHASDRSATIRNSRSRRFSVQV
jgi:predicted DNA-binding protein (MmcQ/YjbR family)